ncbi:glycosyltransferase [Bacillus cereus group sp. Bce040]|uniref:glycosyltransferase n=1 Tax=Bacillus cereus group sp. Bce040 TaxID=3445229 RepID=UPI003F1E9562
MKDIIFLPWRDIHNYRKEGFRVREGNIIKSFSDRHDVRKILIINRAKNLKSIINKSTTGMEIKTEIWPNKKLISTFLGSRLYEIEENMFSLELPVCFFNKGDNVLENSVIFQYYLKLIIKKTTRFLKIDLNSNKTWIWSSDLSRAFVFKWLNETKLNCKKIFDTIDNLVQHKAYTVKQRNRNEKRYQIIDENADIIFSVSKANLGTLYKKRSDQKYFIENGINIERFNNTDAPLMKNNEKIICGYIGVIESRINFELLIELAMKTPQIEYHLVGPVLNNEDVVIQALRKQENVKFIGAVSFEEVPTIIKSFDICIIPHVINMFTCSMSPLKFYEYLAANKPIIMTQVPPAESVNKLNGVYVANTVEEWLMAIEKISVEKTIDLENDTERQLLVQKHSWNKIVEKMVNCI